MTFANHRRSSPPEAQEFTRESDVDWLRSAAAEEEDDTQFTMDDISVISRESQKSLEALVANVFGKKENNPDESPHATKVKANIWEDSFWKRPRNVDEEPPLSPGPMEFCSSPTSDGDPSSPSLDTPPGLDIQRTQTFWPITSKSAIPGHVFDLPKRVSSSSNLAQAGVITSAEHQQNAEPQDLSPVFSIPPAPRDSSIAEPPFITHLRRHSTSSSSSLMVSASDVAAVANESVGSPPQCALPLTVGKPAVIRRGRFEIILGGEDKHPGTSLNPREMSHLHIIL